MAAGDGAKRPAPHGGANIRFAQICEKVYQYIFHD